MERLEGEAGLRVEYELTLGDLEAFHLHRSTIRDEALVRNQAAVAAVATGLLFGLARLRESASVVQAVLAFSVGAVVAFLVFPAYFRWRVRRNVRIVFGGEQGRRALGARVLFLTERGIAESTEEVRVELAWEAIDSAVVTARHVFLESGPSVGLVLPLPSFPAEALELVRRRLGPVLVERGGRPRGRA